MRVPRWLRAVASYPVPLRDVYPLVVDPDAHVHEWVVVHVRGCAHGDPGPFCRRCGERVDQIGLSCADCGQAVVTVDGPPARYDTEEDAIRQLPFIGLNLWRMSDDELRDTIREMQQVGLR